jgi:hypothetical protein
MRTLHIDGVVGVSGGWAGVTPPEVETVPCNSFQRLKGTKSSYSVFREYTRLIRNSIAMTHNQRMPILATFRLGLRTRLLVRLSVKPVRQLGRKQAPNYETLTLAGNSKINTAGALP